MRPKKPSVASLVVAQGRSKSINDANVILLSHRQPSPTHREEGVDKNGVSYLKALFPNSHGSPYEHDLSFLFQFPNLKESFSLGFIEWGGTLDNKTRAECLRNIKGNFFLFLRDNSLQNIGLTELTEAVFAKFIKWLNSPRDNGQPLHPSTRANTLGSVKKFIAALEQLTDWSAAARRVSEAIPKNPWPGSEKRGTPRERLDREHLISIVAAAENEVSALLQRWQQGRDALEIGHVALSKGDRDYRDNLSLCLAAIDAAYPGVIPDISVIRKRDMPLANAFQYVHGQKKLAGYLYPTARDLVPIAILITVATAFNPDSTLDLEWSNYEDQKDRLGSPAIRVVGPKGRAGQDQPRLLDASSEYKLIGPLKLFNLLRDMTARIRSSVQAEMFRDRMFIFVPQRHLKTPKGFGTEKSGATNDACWQFSLRCFAKDHNLKSFTLGQIRPTILDEVQLITGDIFKAQAVGGQKQLQTVWHHYTSHGTKRRYMERIGEVLLLRDRWLTTKGVIDPRQRTAAQDKGAATPGFICLDPYDSPLPSQQKGHLCRGYGECPNCPLAAANVGRAVDVAQYSALRKAIYNAHGRLAPKSWIDRWAPIIASLDVLLSHVPNTVRAEAEKYSTQLPPVG